MEESGSTCDRTWELVRALESGDVISVRQAFCSITDNTANNDNNNNNNKNIIVRKWPWINLSWEDEEGNTLLHLAASLPDAECLTALLEVATEYEAHNTTNHKELILTVPAESNNSNNDKNLRKQEVNLSTSTTTTITTIPVASIPLRPKAVILWKANKERETPLHLAARHCASSTSILLLISYYGVDVSVSAHGDTFLHLLMGNAKLKRGTLMQLMQELLQNANVQKIINVIDHDGCTMLDIVVRVHKSHLSLILILRQHDARTAAEEQLISIENVEMKEEQERERIVYEEVQERSNEHNLYHYHKLLNASQQTSTFAHTSEASLPKTISNQSINNVSDNGANTHELWKQENVIVPHQKEHLTGLPDRDDVDHLQNKNESYNVEHAIHTFSNTSKQREHKMPQEQVQMPIPVMTEEENAVRVLQQWWRSRLTRLRFVQVRHSVNVIIKFWRSRRELQLQTEIRATNIIRHALVKWSFARERWMFITQMVEAQHNAKIAGLTRMVTQLVWRENFINALDSILLRNRRLHSSLRGERVSANWWWVRWQAWCAHVEWLVNIVLFILSAVELIYMAVIPRTDANKIHTYVDLIFIVLQLCLVCILPLCAHHVIDFCVTITALVCAATLNYDGSLLSTWFLFNLPYIVKSLAPHHSATRTFCMALDRTFRFLFMFAPLALAGLWANVRGSAVDSMLDTNNGNVGTMFTCLWNTHSSQYVAYKVENLLPSTSSFTPFHNNITLRVFCLLNSRTSLEHISTITVEHVEVIRMSIIQIILFYLTLMVYCWGSIMLATVNAIRIHYDESDAAILRGIHRREKELASAKNLVTATGAAMIARFETRNQPLLKVEETSTSSLLWERDIQAAREAIEASHYDHTTRYAVHLFVNRIMESVALMKRGVPWELPYNKPEMSTQLTTTIPTAAPIVDTSPLTYRPTRSSTKVTSNTDTSTNLDTINTAHFSNANTEANDTNINANRNVNSRMRRSGNPLAPSYIEPEPPSGVVESSSSSSENVLLVNTLIQGKRKVNADNTRSTNINKIAEAGDKTNNLTTTTNSNNNIVNNKIDNKKRKESIDDHAKAKVTSVAESQTLSETMRRWDCRNEDYRLRVEIDKDVMYAALSMTPRLRWFERFMLRQWTSTVLKRETSLMLLVMVIMAGVEPDLLEMEFLFSAIFTIELIISFAIFPLSFFSQHYGGICIRIFCILVGFIPNANPYVVFRAIRFCEGWKWRLSLPGLLRWSALYLIYLLLVMWCIASVASVQNWRAIELEYRFKIGNVSQNDIINLTTKNLVSDFTRNKNIFMYNSVHSDVRNAHHVNTINNITTDTTFNVNAETIMSQSIKEHSICSHSVSNCFMITLREMVLPTWTPEHIDPNREAPVMSLIVIIFQLFVIPFILSFVFHPLRKMTNTTERFLRLVISTIHDELLEYVHNFIEGEFWFARWTFKIPLPSSAIVKLKMWVYDSHRINAPDAKIVNSSRYRSTSDYVSEYRFQRQSSFVTPINFTSERSETNKSNSNTTTTIHSNSNNNINYNSYSNNNDNNIEEINEIISKSEFASFEENEQWDNMESGKKGWPRWMAFKRTPLLHYLNFCLTLVSLAFLWIVDASYTRNDSIVLIASAFHFWSIISALLVMPTDATSALTIISCLSLLVSSVFMLLPLSLNFRYYYCIRFISVLRIGQIELGALRNLQRLFKVFLKLTVIIYFPLIIVGLLLYSSFLLNAQIYLVTHRLPDCSSYNPNSSTNASDNNYNNNNINNNNSSNYNNSDKCAGSVNWTFEEQLASHPWRHSSRPNTEDTRNLFLKYFAVDSHILYSIFTTWMLPAFCITTIMAYQLYYGVVQRATEYFVIQNIKLMEDPMTLARFPLPRRSLRWFSNVMLVLSLIYGCVISPATHIVRSDQADLKLFFGLEIGFTVIGLSTSIVSVLYAMHRCGRTQVSCSEWSNDYLFAQLHRGEWIMLCGEIVTLVYYSIALVLSGVLLNDQEQCVISPTQYSFYFITVRFVLLIRFLPREYMLYFINHFSVFFYSVLILVAYFISAASAVADLAVTLYAYQRELGSGETQHITPRLWRNAGAMLLRATFTSVVPDNFQLSLPWFNASELFIQNTKSLFVNNNSSYIAAYWTLNNSNNNGNDTNTTIVFLKVYASTKLIFALSVIGKFLIAVIIGILISVFALPLQTCSMYPLPTNASLMYNVLRGGVKSLLRYGITHQQDMRMESRCKLQKRKFVNAFTSHGIPSWALPHLLEELNICTPSRQRRFMFLLRSLLEYLPISERRQIMVEEYVDMWDCFSAGGPASVWFSSLPTYPESYSTALTKATKARTTKATAKFGKRRLRKTQQSYTKEELEQDKAHDTWKVVKHKINNLIRWTNKLYLLRYNWFPDIAYSFAHYIFESKKPVIESNKKYISPIRLIQALAVIELDFPANSSVNTKLWLDFFLVTQRLRAATMLQALWRMYKTEKIFEETHSLCESIRIAILRRQFRKYRVSSDVVFRTYNSFALATRVQPLVFNLGTDHFYLLNKLRSRYADLKPTNEFNLVSKFSLGRNATELTRQLHREHTIDNSFDTSTNNKTDWAKRQQTFSNPLKR